MTATASPTIDWDIYRTLVPQGTEPELDDTFALSMREIIVVHYMYLAERVVNQMLKSMPAHVDKKDLVSWAYLGLIKSVARYNHTLGVPFEAYAIDCMKRAIMDGVRAEDWAPRSLRKKQRDIDKTEEALTKKFGRTPTDEELAERLDIAPAEIGAVKYKTEIASHTYLEGCTEALNKTVDFEEDDLVTQIRLTVAKAMKSLPIAEAVVIALRYYENKNLAEVAKIMHMSTVKVGQLHQKAVLSLWEAVEALAKSD